MVKHLISSIRNRGDGTYAPDVRSEAVVNIPKGVHGSDAHFLDYDNDGFLDLWLIGTPKEGDGRGVFLFRNDGTGRFTDASNILPNTIRSGGDGTIGDYDNDGDLDLFLIDSDGKAVALRNEGGDQNSWLQVKLEGVNAGNNKNNIDGIGAKVELKAGELYQMKYVTDPITHFGLGKEKQADVLRGCLDKRRSTKRHYPQIKPAHPRKAGVEGVVPIPLRL